MKVPMKEKCKTKIISKVHSTKIIPVTMQHTVNVKR